MGITPGRASERYNIQNIQRKQAQYYQDWVKVRINELTTLMAESPEIGRQRFDDEIAQVKSVNPNLVIPFISSVVKGAVMKGADPEAKLELSQESPSRQRRSEVD